MVLAAQNCGCPIVEEGPSLVNSPVCSGNFMFMMLLQQYLWGRCSISTPCKRLESVKETKDTYDFIVVGAGTAGSIVAARLSENCNYSVLLLEAGGPEPLGVRVPSFYRTFWGNEEVDWRARTEPADYCLDQDGQGCQWPLGKGCGGTSLFNGMMYSRGHAADYDDWVAAGAEGWSWDELRPFMDMAEGNREVGKLVSAEHHSSTGKMPIQRFNFQPPEVYDMMDAINQTGIPIINDMNDPNTPVGFTIAQAFTENGQRYTTARAYLEPKSERPNLEMLLYAYVTRVLFDGTRAYAVEYVDKNGNTKTVNASKEIVLSAGALGSPKILMLSGVGPKEVLEPLKIPVIANLPVGKNLKNHCGATLYFVLTAVNNTQALDWSALTEFLLLNKGPMSSTGLTQKVSFGEVQLMKKNTDGYWNFSKIIMSQLTGLLYSSYADQSKKQPDLQFFFNGLYAECSKTGVIGEAAGGCSSSGYNISANAVALLPRSVGWVTINSTDPFDRLLKYPNFFSEPEDIEIIKEGLQYLRKIFNSELLQKKYKIKLDPEYTTVCDKKADTWSDEWMECMIRVYTDPQNHQMGTTAIGKVTDPQLRVYDTFNLRVIDAGNMPSQPTGNPQGAIMAVAERGAHFIKETWK